MKFTLTDYQKEQLKQLFNETEVDHALLFLKVENNLSEIELPKEGSNKVKALDESSLMEDISTTAIKLSKLISRLDESLQQKLSFSLAEQLFDNISIVECNKYHQKADAKEMLRRLHSSASFQSSFIKGRYGKSIWDRTVDAICHSWPTELATESRITLNCRLLKFFSIILDELSHEKILKFIKRSAWYRQHFILDTSWQDKL